MNTTKHIEISEVSSTNDYLKRLATEEELLEGFVIAAKYQTSGRGQGENSWESEKGKNLTFSLLLRPNFLNAENMFMISKVISLGIIDYLNSFEDNFEIKWPNDIYYKHKKLGGILIENSLLGNKLSYSLIGIGININQEIFVSDAPNPISLKNVFNKEFHLTECLKGILKQIDIWYDILKSGKYDKVNEAYFLNLFRKEDYHNYRENNEQFSAKIVDVESDGKLVLKTTDSKIRAFYFKEVEFVL